MLLTRLDKCALHTHEHTYIHIISSAIRYCRGDSQEGNGGMNALKYNFLTEPRDS